MMNRNAHTSINRQLSGVRLSMVATVRCFHLLSRLTVTYIIIQVHQTRVPNRYQQH